MTASSSEAYALYDTSVLIDIEHLDLGAYIDSITLVSAISIGELAFGLDTGSNPDRRRQRLQDVLDRYEVLPYGAEEAKLYGVLATLVRAAGRNPRPRRVDLQIAATAAAARVPLLTANPVDFLGADRLVDVVPVSRLV